MNTLEQAITGAIEWSKNERGLVRLYRVGPHAYMVSDKPQRLPLVNAWCNGQLVERATMPNMRLDWTQTGQPFTATDDQRERILGAIAAIDAGSTGPGEYDRWHELPGKLTLSMMAGMGIEATIRQFKLPRVSHVSISAACSPCGLYGIRAHYGREGGQQVEVFVVDTGDAITPVLCRVFETEADTSPTPAAID